MAESDLVYQYGSLIPITAYKVVIGTVFALALVSYGIGISIKFKKHYFLLVDELLLLLAVVFLIPSTALAYAGAGTFYKGYTVLQYTNLVSSISADDYDALAGAGFVWFSTFSLCAWTAIFCCKAYLLRVSWHLLRRISWIRGRFQGVVVCTSISWALLFASAFILQPYGYFEPDSYVGHGGDVLFLAMSSLATALDGATSLMVALLLYVRFSRLKRQDAHRKFVLISWTALSIMVIFTILRVSRLYDAVHIDMVWMVLWQYLEAGTAIVILSIAVLHGTISAEPGSGKVQKGIVLHGEVLTYSENVHLEETNSKSHQIESGEARALSVSSSPTTPVSSQTQHESIDRQKISFK